MNSKIDLSKIIGEVLRKEAEALTQLSKTDFETLKEVIDVIVRRKGKVITTGIGKSGVVAQKFASTLSSTGTSSVFLNTNEALHGDMGLIQEDDTVIIISKNGNNKEFRALVPFLQKMNIPVIAFVCNKESYIYKHSSVAVYIPFNTEADPNNIAPTTSVLLQLAICDALAIALQEYKEHTAEDFAALHPGGSLGKKLTLTIHDFAPELRKPMVRPESSIREVIVQISSGMCGAVAVVTNDTLSGIITDGDLRRMLENNTSIDSLQAKDIMNVHPKYLDIQTKAINALELMEEHSISQVLVISNGLYVGMIHLHQLVKEGLK